MSPLLSAEDARVEAHGDVLVDSLSFNVDGERVGLLGDWTPLFRLFSRVASLTRGQVRVMGHDAENVVGANRLGIALSGAVYPPTWSTNEYLEASARLLGLGRRPAASAARDALDVLGLGALRKRALGTLDNVERRAFGVAQATLGNPTALLFDRPFDGLSDPAKIWIEDVLDRAARGLRLIVGAQTPAGTGVEARLFERLDQVAVMVGGRVVSVGAPRDVFSTSRRCVVRASRSLSALSEALVARGLGVERMTSDHVGDDGKDDGRLLVDLPEGKTSAAIVEAALAVQAPLLELVPLGFDIAK